MEKVTDINRWLLNPEHRPLGLVECRSLRRRTAFGLCLLGFVRSLRRFSSFDFRLPLPAWFGKHSPVYRNGKVSAALLEGRFRCLEGSGDRLSEQKPYKDIDRSRKKFLSCNFRGIAEHICRTRVLVGGLLVVRKLFVRCTLADPFDVAMETFWPKCTIKLKSITVIFSYNLLYLLALQQFTKTLTGQ